MPRARKPAVKTRRTLFDAMPGGGVCRCLNEASSVVCADCPHSTHLSEPALIEAIDAERFRLGMSVMQPVRIGTRDGKVWAALSRHMDSLFREGAHKGDTIAQALASLLDKLRTCERHECACEKWQGCGKCAGVGSFVEVRK